MRYWLSLALVAIAIASGAYLLLSPAPAELPAGLEERAANSRPDWANFDEDLKGSLGASAVAQWQGEPVRASVNAGAVEVVFRIHGPWATQDAGVPVLLRDPLGKTRTSVLTKVVGREAFYLFRLDPPGTRETIPPWVIVRYPGAEKRLAFDDTGKWYAPDDETTDRGAAVP